MKNSGKKMESHVFIQLKFVVNYKTNNWISIYTFNEQKCVQI